MSRRAIDVLAVLDDLAKQSHGALGQGIASHVHDAREAVTELITVAQKAVRYPPAAIGKPLHDGFRAALSRCGVKP